MVKMLQCLSMKGPFSTLNIVCLRITAVSARTAVCSHSLTNLIHVINTQKQQ